MRILAIDPGSANVGYADLHGQELLDWGSRDLRLGGKTWNDVCRSLDKLVNRLVAEKRPDAVVLERNNFSVASHNARTASVANRIRTLARKNGTKLVEIGPRTVRRVVCSDGNASKGELARTVAMQYPELRIYLTSDRNYKAAFFQNALDAVACGLAYLAVAEKPAAKED